MMNVFVKKETGVGETRVAATPETVGRMVKSGLGVIVESGAGDGAGISDADFTRAGATIGSGAGAKIVVKVAPPTEEEAAALPADAVLISFLLPAQNLTAVKALADAKVTAFAMDLVPRITKAQKMDALSSQANLAGYKAVLLGANALGRMFPLMMTAAGTIKPARVFVFGAGVAGLQAIATARRLGAVVEATDIRAAAKEQVESLGGRFVFVEPDEDMEDAGGYAKEATDAYKKKQAAVMAEHIAGSDVVITTALVPGRKAPVLVSESDVQGMRAGSVVVDIATAQGGNCALSERGKTVVKNGVTIVGEDNLPALIAADASNLYARNVLQAVQHLAKDGELVLDFEDEITLGSVAVHGGEIRHAPTAEALQSGATQS